MKIGINSQSQIKQIGDITDINLRTIELDDTSDNFQFKGWSNTRILSSCYNDNGLSVSVYPYIDDTKIVETENEILNLQAQVIELEFEKIGGTTI
jgi:hypothetical protein